jgi:quinol monooxygenase YgiN
MSNVVSLHPYFKAHPGELETFKALLPKFVEKTATEEACLYYDFSIHDDEIFCREAYVGGEGVITHIENVGELLGKALESSDLTRIEVHGPAAELEKVKALFADLNPTYFELACGVAR